MELSQEKAPSPQVFAIDSVDNQYLINEAGMRGEIGDGADFDRRDTEEPGQ
jgi:hypothetical protein